MIALDLVGLAWGFFLLGCGIFLILLCGIAIIARHARKQLDDYDRDESWRW